MPERIQLRAMPIDIPTVEGFIRLDVDDTARVSAVKPLSAPAVRTALRVELEGGRTLICKLCEGEGEDAFDGEAYQLGYLADRTKLPVPRVLAHRKEGGPGPFTCMILEALPGVPCEEVPAGAQREVAEAELGDLLGRTHAELTALQYGRVRQAPGPDPASWPNFFAALWHENIEEVLRSDRLDPLTLEAVEWIHRNIHSLLEVHPLPRLVYGNLTGESILCLKTDGVWHVSGFLDPDLFYGHHEVDLAFLEFCCGAGEVFLERYRRHLPLEAGYTLRKHVYRLHYLLRQVRLYGSSHHILAVMESSREILGQCGC